MQQGDGQGVADDIVQFPGDAVAFLRSRLLGQAGLSLPQLHDQASLTLDQQAEQHGEGSTSQPRTPARIGLDPQPFHREEDHRTGPARQAVPAVTGQRAPADQQADREPADVVRYAVRDDRDPGGGHGGVEQLRPPPP